MKWFYHVRQAARNDLDTLVSFTIEEAREAEGKEKIPDLVRRGVLAGLEDPTLATYWVANSQDSEVVAMISVVREWSNWHAGYYWWIQSLFVLPEHRGRRLVEQLMNAVEEAARAAGALDLRLYAHTSNLRAMLVYQRCGFATAPYTIMIKQLPGD